MVQVDVKTAFPNDKLEEYVYVPSPRGILGHPPRPCRLIKALFGLKQAHRAWLTNLCADMNNLGFEELPNAPCVFMKKDGSDVCFVFMYVDDLLAISPSVVDAKSIVDHLAAVYELRQMD